MGERYEFLCANVFSRYSWVKFVREKFKTFKVCRAICLQLQREQDKGVVRIHSDHGHEFDNIAFNEFCALDRIFHEFSASLTSQQNGVVECMNRTFRRWLE